MDFMDYLRIGAGGLVSVLDKIESEQRRTSGSTGAGINRAAQTAAARGGTGGSGALVGLGLLWWLNK